MCLLSFSFLDQAAFDACGAGTDVDRNGTGSISSQVLTMSMTRLVPIIRTIGRFVVTGARATLNRSRKRTKSLSTGKARFQDGFAQVGRFNLSAEHSLRRYLWAFGKLLRSPSSNES
jgi:hypothetical protein